MKREKKKGIIFFYYYYFLKTIEMHEQESKEIHLMYNNVKEVYVTRE